ncbi:hypothetical protein FHG87_013307, partial [Trinorchestia longiramus]
PDPAPMPEDEEDDPSWRGSDDSVSSSKFDRMSVPSQFRSISTPVQFFRLSTAHESSRKRSIRKTSVPLPMRTPEPMDRLAMSCFGSPVDSPTPTIFVTPDKDKV